MQKETIFSGGSVMFNKLFTKRFCLFMLFLIVMIFGLFCCEEEKKKDDNHNNDQPPAQAEITIRSEPDPVPFYGDNNDYHYWAFSFIVEEKAGVGASILEWNCDMYSNDGSLLTSATHTVDEFIQWFDDCDQNTGHINPNGSFCCATFAYLSKNHETGWYAIDKMKFRDDNGNEFWSEGKFTFLPIQ
ncbi:MAG: hypothetical protein A2161_22510 [Candidatus Schekmanbacteria bacterium RBG_13_48_7]|uniref:Uncharacterized protein n=1 Tax=Candidatus Schekmanbacteria bacterium RBG_13_48_7 TaxID=1817878 RepID=A0A1F7RRY3_9BACT|nr:MAG: hypothetical protein A2161_22510 [Candidatus Schekmanbacteria bacterium RBG_13_48_7]